jgi:signal transduction histidine kinase
MGGPPAFLDAAFVGFLCAQAVAVLLRARGQAGKAILLTLFLLALGARLAAGQPDLGAVPVSLLAAWPAGELLLRERGSRGRLLWAAASLLFAGTLLLASGLGFRGTLPYEVFRVLAVTASGAPPVVLAVGIAVRRRSPALLAAGVSGALLFAGGAVAAALAALGHPQPDFPRWAAYALALSSGWLLFSTEYPRGGPLGRRAAWSEGGATGRPGVYARLLRTEAALLLQDRLAAEGLLAAGAAHELKGTLSHIRTTAQAALSREDGGKLRAGLELVDDLAEAGQRSAVGFMERLSRQGREEAVTLDLGELAAAVLAPLRPSLRASGIVVRAEVTAGLRVRARRGEMEQVLFNLVQNAAEAYLGQDGDGEREIVLWGREAERSAVLEVRDRAGGIPPEAVSRLFEIGLPGARGTGLGLFIARSLAERNSAFLGYEPQEGGSCFRIEIPLEEPGEGPDAPGASGPGGGRA